jgi:hypothetical protein
MRRFHLLLSLAFAAGLPAQNFAYFTATLDGTQEVPPVITQAKGWGIVRLDPATSAISIFVRSQGLTGTAAHLHLAPAGQNGGVVINLTQGSPGIWTGGAAPAPANVVTALQAGNTYLNVHTAANPGGEIRGQVGQATVDNFDSVATLTLNFGGGAIPVTMNGPVKVVRSAALQRPDQRWEMITELLSCCMETRHPILGHLQLRMGTELGNLSSLGSVVSNNPAGQFSFPATGQFGVLFSLHGKWIDLAKCDTAPAVNMQNTTITALPPFGADYAPTVTFTITLRDPCTGITSTSVVQVHSRHRPVSPPTAPPPTLIRHCSTITITNNANLAGSVELFLCVAPGEPGAGTLVATSGMLPVVAGRTPAQTASALAGALQSFFDTNRPCCPCSAVAVNNTVTVCCRTRQRFNCYLAGTGLPPAGVNLDKTPLLVHLGQRYSKRGLREWLPWGDRPPRPPTNVMFTGNGCAYNQPNEEPLTIDAYGVPIVGNTVAIGLEGGGQTWQLPHFIFLGTSPVAVPVPGFCGTLMTLPVVTLFAPTNQAREIVLPLAIPNQMNLQGAVILWQGGNLNPGLGRGALSDLMTMVIG